MYMYVMGTCEGTKFANVLDFANFSLSCEGCLKGLCHTFLAAV